MDGRDSASILSLSEASVGDDDDVELELLYEDCTPRPTFFTEDFNALLRSDTMRSVKHSNFGKTMRPRTEDELKPR